MTDGKPLSRCATAPLSGEPEACGGAGVSEGKPLSRCATAPLSGEPKASVETPIGLRPLSQKREARAVGRWPTVIACDFDGTLCESAWPEIGAPHWPIIHELIRRQREGARIILWTCREGELLENAVMWCMNQGIKFDAINSNVAERIEQYGDDPRKVSADEYWDDRSVLVSGGNSLLRAEPECYWMQTWEETTLTCAGQKGKSRFGVWIRGLWKRIVPKGTRRTEGSGLRPRQCAVATGARRPCNDTPFVSLEADTSPEGGRQGRKADCHTVGRHAHMPPKRSDGGAIRGSLPTVRNDRESGRP